jgi:serine/threonine-protein kinase
MDSSLQEQLAAALAGRYTIDRELGRGGMAIVYLARDVRHERLVAVKVLRPEFGPALGAERFLREIRLAAGLQHPHILPLYDSGEAGGQLYYVMPYVEGESLRARLDRQGPFPVDEAVRYAREVAEALSYAHERDVVHRDIKPDNILLSGGHALVADFGIARAINAAGGLKLTETGMAVGTPAYMSPEQAMGDQRVDGRADIYALGCVLFEMLAGEPPFTGPSAQGVMARHSMDPVPPLATVRPGVAPALEAAIACALAKVPADRYTTATEFAGALAAALPAASAPRHRSVSRVAVVLLVVIMGTTALAWFAARRVAVSRAEAPAEPLQSIAVLPLRNLGDSGDAYLAEGVAEQIAGTLVRLPKVAVKSWATVLEAVKHGRQPAELGSRLRVAYVLDGNLQRSGTRVRVGAQLVRTRDASIVWSGQYNGRGSDVFAIQDSIAGGVVRELALWLTPEEGRTLTHRTTRNAEAYNLYLVGRHFQWRFTADALRSAAAYFRQAIARDPGYADAYVALGESYEMLVDVDPGPRAVARDSARALLRRALAIDSTNGDAYRLLAAWLEPCDLAERERHYQLAMRYRPGSAVNHMFYAQFLNQLGRHAEALAEAQRAAELDPVTPWIIANLAYRYLMDGQYTRAVEHARDAAALDSSDWVARAVLGVAFSMQGDLDRGIANLELANRMVAAGHAFTTADLGWAYGRAGRRPEAKRAAQQLAESPALVAMVYVGLGDVEQTFHWLDVAYPADQRYVMKELWLREFDPVRSNPRFVALMRRAGCR